jgi:hypothetical protein
MCFRPRYFKGDKKRFLAKRAKNAKNAKKLKKLKKLKSDFFINRNYAVDLVPTLHVGTFGVSGVLK